VTRIVQAKANDPRRQRTAEIFRAWSKAHGEAAVAVRDLSDTILALIDPQNRGRQYVARTVATFEGTRLAGFVMTRQQPNGKWGVSTYALKSRCNQQS
jgi:hypothetical protein